MIDKALAEVRGALRADPSRAEALARDILREHPREPDALLLLAIALRKKNAHASARAILETLVQDQPQMPQAHYELGLARSHAGDNLGAMESLRAAVDLDPDFVQAWHAMGDQMTRLHSRKGADAAYANAFYARVKEPLLRDAVTAQRAGRLDEARKLLLEHLEAQPDDVTALKMLGEIALKEQRVLRAEQLFARCVELAPDFIGARFRYATVLMTQNKPTEAIDQIDEILKREPGDPYHRNLKAASLIRMSAFEEAAAEYETMLEAHPNQPGAWLAYGHALKAIGRRDDAVAAYKKTMSLVPGLGESYWGLANLKTYRFAPAEMEAMRAQLARSDLKGDNRAMIFFAYGRALEDDARYAESFQSYARGNAIVHGSVPYDPDETSDQLRRAKALFTSAFFAARAGLGAAAPDPIFVVGLPRSGSTLVEQILASHSRVEGTTELRAIPYLAGRLGGKLKPGDPLRDYPESLAGLDGAALKGLGEEYLWRAATHRRTQRPLFIDKMPNNFAHVGLIHLVLPNAKIVDVRRHPLACGWSNFAQHFGNGQAFSYGLADIGRYYADYVELMAHWDVVLPGKVHRVIYEDLVADPQAQTRALLAYLGLPFEEACLRFHQNARVVRSASAEQVRRPLNREGLEHWRHFEPWLGPMKAQLGFVLDAYPRAPEFYSRLHAKLGYADGWGTSDQHWSGETVRAAPDT
jgi:tetratricopeptide (TPR) repeat protein